jgi:hypothetical protein
VLEPPLAPDPVVEPPLAPDPVVVEPAFPPLPVVPAPLPPLPEPLVLGFRGLPGGASEQPRIEASTNTEPSWPGLIIREIDCMCCLSPRRSE